MQNPNAVLESITALAPTIGYISLIVLGGTQILKKFVSDKYAPLAALVIGLGMGFLFLKLTVLAVIVGLVSALMSMGLFSGTKAVVTQ